MTRGNGLTRSESPFGSLFSMWDDVFSDPWWSGFEMTSVTPAIDVSDENDKVVVRAEVPGVDAKDLKLELKHGVLSISGEKKTKKEDKSKGRHTTECTYGSFFRNVALPSSVDESSVDARYEDGVLTVSLTKSPGTSSKNIEIKTK